MLNETMFLARSFPS